MTPRASPLTIPVSLRRLFPAASFVGCGDVVAMDATERSGQCVPGSVFAVIHGTRVHGRDFVPEALRRGASAVLSDRPLPEVRVPQCIVPHVRAAYAELCHALHGYPSRQLGLIGVTGTNGKTTTAWLVRSLLETSGRQCGLLGTIEYSDGVERSASDLTTPDSRSLAEWLGRMVRRQTRFAAAEFSSHALDQGRSAGTQLDVAIVTNVTQDHFDYHADANAYLAAKANILGMVKRGGLVVLNADDPCAAGLLDRVARSRQACTFGLQRPADVHGRILDQSREGTQFLITRGTERVEITTPLIGRHNVSNCLAAAAAGLHLGLSLFDVAAGIESLSAVPGRLECIDAGQNFGVFVDYAHTEDALDRVIRAVRDVTPGRVFCVFGAGGDRDRAKRPRMGRAAAAADVPVVTSDNPRSESPAAIIEEILAGMADAAAAAHVEPDRERAIAWALQAARPGDAVIVAGKGHERMQIVGGERIPFDDRTVCRKWLSRLKSTVGNTPQNGTGDWEACQSSPLPILHSPVPIPHSPVPGP